MSASYSLENFRDYHILDRHKIHPTVSICALHCTASRSREPRREDTDRRLIQTACRARRMGPPTMVNLNSRSDATTDETGTNNAVSSVIFQTPDTASALAQATTLQASNTNGTGHPRGIAPRILGGSRDPSTRRPVLWAIFTRNSSKYLARLSSRVSPGGGVQHAEVLRSCLERGLEIVECLGSQPARWNGQSGEKCADLSDDAALGVSAGDFMKNARAKNKRYCMHTQRNLFWLRHAGGCSGYLAGDACKVEGCEANRQLWVHLKSCADITCKYPRCMYASWEVRACFFWFVLFVVFSSCGE